MHRDRFGIEPVCAVLEFPVSSYYFAKKRASEPTARETRDAILEDKIMEVWKGRKGREVYGARKVWLELNRQGIPVARCTVERLMRDLAIGGVRSRRKRPRTTVPGDPAGRPSDLLQRCFDAPAPNRCSATCRTSRLRAAATIACAPLYSTRSRTASAAARCRATGPNQ